MGGPGTSPRKGGGSGGQMGGQVGAESRRVARVASWWRNFFPISERADVAQKRVGAGKVDEVFSQ